MSDATGIERGRVPQTIAEDTSQLRVVADAMMGFLETGNLQEASTLILRNAIDQTESEYGYVGVIVDGPVFRILAHEGFVWDDKINREYYENAMRGLEERGYMDFDKLDNLFGRVITDKQVIVSNSPAADPRGAGIPPGHPPLRSFLGVPSIKGNEVIGTIGVANRPGGYSGIEQLKIEILTQALGVMFDSYRRMQREAVLEVERQRAEATLKERTTNLETFSYSVSHDLRAPLRAIDGFSGILLEDYGDKLDPECNRLLNLICNNAKAMGQLIDDLLAFSRLGRQEMKLTDIDIGESARSVLNELGSSGPERKMEVRIGTLPSARGDPAMIRQVFANLLSNGIKFTQLRETPRIEVGHRNEDEDNENIYYVKDNGVGFDMRYAEKMFGVFQRLHGADEFEGTGVGLAVVHSIIQRHGGRVWAEGKINEGATIYFTLPPAATKK